MGTISGAFRRASNGPLSLEASGLACRFASGLTSRGSQVRALHRPSFSTAGLPTARAADWRPFATLCNPAVHNLVLEGGHCCLLLVREEVPVATEEERTAVLVADDGGDHGDMNAGGGHQRDERVPQVVKDDARVVAVRVAAVGVDRA